MTDAIVFKGTQYQIIQQLAQYMNPDDAQKFFRAYFNQGIIQGGVTAYHSFEYSQASAGRRVGVTIKVPHSRAYPRVRRYLCYSGKSKYPSSASKSIRYRKSKRKLILADKENNAFVIDNRRKRFFKNIFQSSIYYCCCRA